MGVAHGLEAGRAGDGWVGSNKACCNLCWGLGAGPRWEELHTLASEPREQHVLMAEQVEDATNGLFSALSSSDVCTFASPGTAFQAGPRARGVSVGCKWDVGWGGFP